MKCFSGTLLFAGLLFAAASTCVAQEKHSLMALIAEWQYPNSKINGATMADGKTVDSDGNRTVQSIVCKTVLTTGDSVEKVIEYYKGKLAPEKKAEKPRGEQKDKAGRSVVFHDDSDGRPFAMHVIIVNTDSSSTTLIITRGANESTTRIAWKHYLRF